MFRELQDSPASAEITTLLLDHTCDPSSQKKSSIYHKSTVKKIPTKILQSLVGLVKVKASLSQYKAFIISNKLALQVDTQSLENLRKRVRKAMSTNEVDTKNYAGYFIY